MPNIVYIATSLDGFIADRNDGLDWLGAVPNPDGDDFGFVEFMESVDALLMGRKTFDAVRSFDCEWPYQKPTYILSSTLTEIPADLEGKAFIVRGPLQEAFKVIREAGHDTIYVDGGNVIQGCLEEDLIDEMMIFRMPVLLGGGVPLFGNLSKEMSFEHKDTEVFLNAIVKSHYIRTR